MLGVNPVFHGGECAQRKKSCPPRKFADPDQRDVMRTTLRMLISPPMDMIPFLIDFILHVDKHLAAYIVRYNVR